MCRGPTVGDYKRDVNNEGGAAMYSRTAFIVAFNFPSFCVSVPVNIFNGDSNDDDEGEDLSN